VPSVKVTADFGAQIRIEASSQPQRKEKAMKKPVQPKTNDGTCIETHVNRLSKKVRRLMVGVSLAAVTLLTVHGGIGIQSALAR
jgi:hypothetical protein